MRLRDNRTQKFKFRRNSIFQKMASTLWKKKKKKRNLRDALSEIDGGTVEGLAVARSSVIHPSKSVPFCLYTKLTESP